MNAAPLFPSPGIGSVARGCRRVPGTVLLLMLLHTCALQSSGQNAWWYADDPFVSADLEALGSLFLADWTSSPGGSSSSPSVAVERIGPTGALEQPFRRSLAPAPPGAAFLLLNQYAQDISVFSLSQPLPKGAPGDTDGNGLVDAWEKSHFHQIGTDPSADADGDGFTNLAESEAGTDPTSASSRPLIAGVLGLWAAEGSPEDSALGHTSTWIGPPTYVEGRIGRAFSVSGSRSIRVSDAPDLRPTRGISIAAWIRLARTTCNLQPILARPSSREGQPAFALSVYCSGIGFGLASEFASSLDGPSALSLSTGVWYHVASTWDGTNTQIYLNGKLAFGLRRPAGFGPLDLPVGRDLRIGSDGATQSFEGDLDQIVLANRALTGEEVQWLAGGNGGPRGAISDSSLVLEREDQTVWRLDPAGGMSGLLSHGYNAQLSPDRRRLFFRRAQTSPGDAAPEHLWLRDLVNGEEIPLFSIPRAGNVLSFDWAADSKSIVAADTVQRVIQRYSLTETSTLPTTLVNTSPQGAPSEIAVSGADGSLAWFMSTGTIALDSPWTSGPNGAGPRALPHAQSAQFASRYHRPSWSPDGRKLALVSGRNLFISDPRGDSISALSFYTGQATDPVFLDTTPRWTLNADYLVAVATFPLRDTASRVVYVPTDGSGSVVERSIDGGAAPAGVIFGGNGPETSTLKLAIRFEPPTTEQPFPRLIFSTSGGVDDLILESVSHLDGIWQPQAGELLATSSQRSWKVILDPDLPARFYRLERPNP